MRVAPRKSQSLFFDTLANPGGTNEFAARPDLIGTPLPMNRSPNNFLAFSPFSDKFSNRFGGLTGNALLGPHFANADVRFATNCSLSERKTLQCGAQVFNVVNRLNFALPEHSTKRWFGRVWADPIKGG